MKKIVALVLAMVMVLGLATTAFAAKGGATYNGANAAKDNYNWDFTVSPEEGEDAEESLFATYTIKAVAKKNMDEAYLFWDEATETDIEKGDDFDVEINGEDEFVKVAAGMPHDVVIVDGNTISYYATAEQYNEDGFAGKAVKVTLPVLPIDDADRKCNTLYAWGPNATTFYFFEGMLWNASTTAWTEVLNVNGEVVLAYPVVNMKNATEFEYWAHDFQLEKGYINHNNVGEGDTDWGVTKVYCDNCKATFKFVEHTLEEVAVAVFGEDNYERVLNTVFIEKISPAIPGVTGAAGGAAADGETVESAKTFDAGIAMYVGMSVMAAAGSAVVLKKKD